MGPLPILPEKGQPQKGPPPTGYTGAKGCNPDIGVIKDWCNPESSEYVGKANIGLHLGVVDPLAGMSLPAVYAGHIVTGWELIGLDVDTYKDKKGFQQLLKLQEQYGELPATVKSSSRWSSGTTSFIAIFLVPKGFRYIGKAAAHIDIVQKRHRYMMCWPSKNPDANLQVYEWRGPDGEFIEIPTLLGVGVLPEAWWNYLSNNGVPESDDPISDLTGNELLKWAKDTWRDSDGEMCEHMSRDLQKYIDSVEAAPESHPQLITAHNRLIRNGAEGHTGWLTALAKFNTIWDKSQRMKRDSPDNTRAEIFRSAVGVIGKIEPNWGVLLDDPCVAKQAVADGEYDARLDNWAYSEQCPCGNPSCPGCDDGRRIAAQDFDGLGPVIGRLKVLKDKSPDEYGQNDDGNAEHLIDLYGDNIKYISARKSWTIWLPPDGDLGSGRWYADFDETLARMAFKRVALRNESFARSCAFAAAQNPTDTMLKKKAQSWKTWAKTCGDIGRIKTGLEATRKEWVNDKTPVTLPGNEFDTNPLLLGCANGVLELAEDPTLRDPLREDYVTYNTSVPYIPWRDLANADDINLDGYHLWDEYLDTFLPDRDLRHFIHKVMGHLLIGANPEKLLIFLYGPHDTGKSTMLGAIASALGDYCGNIDINMFRSRQFNPQLVTSVPKRVTTMSEVDAGVMDAAIIKRLTGNDPIVSEIKFSNQKFEGRPQFTTLIACNTPPGIQNTDEALRERILTLPFNSTIGRDRRQYERQDQISRYSGIAVLSWLVEGWRLYCHEGIGRNTWPSIIKDMNREIISGFSQTQAFIDDMLQKARDCEDGILAENLALDKARSKNRAAARPADWAAEWTPVASEVYALYVRWCAGNGAPALPQGDFSRELGCGRPQPRSVNGSVVRCYMGVRVRGSL